jgi:murein DD-endopeptidase MepM/ murein hydrolase activator NlpD
MNPVPMYRQVSRPLFAMALAGFVTGCYGTLPMQSNVPQQPVTVSTSSPEQALPSTYRVGPGDTIYVVARRFNLSVRALINANAMQPPFQINPGQVLKLPSGGGYVVQKGDTLSRVAKKTGSQFSTLARINGMKPPYVIHVGQTLRLPDSDGQPGQDMSVMESPNAAAQKSNAVASTPVAPPAPSSGQSADSYRPLAERDAPSNPVVIATSPALQTRTAPAAEAKAPPGAPTPAAAESAAPPMPAPQNVAMVTPPLAGMPEIAPVSGSGFAWPVNGEVIAGFGTYGKDQHNDGINIKVPIGTPVKAAADGTVVYAGNELRGFGNLLLIKHANGFMSAYAHNDTLLVKRGDSVRRGQVVARSGDSGGVSPPQLHFELRRGVRPIDPATELPDVPRT